MSTTNEKKIVDGYRFDFISRTLIVTKEFLEKANTPDSNEYQIIQKFKNDFPGMRITNRSHRTPKSYHNSDGTVTKKNQYAGLTYKKMELFIMSLPNGTDYLTPFCYLKQVSCYARVREWFLEQFPYYRTNPIYYLYNTVDVIDYTDYCDEQKAS